MLYLLWFLNLISLKFKLNFNKFICHNKPPRFTRAVLYRAIKLGGLGVPQIWLYYVASRFLQLAQWNITESHVLWLRFEQASISLYYLPGLLWSSKPPVSAMWNRNIVAAHSLKLWDLYRHKLALISKTPHGPLFWVIPGFLQPLRTRKHFNGGQTRI